MTALEPRTISTRHFGENVKLLFEVSVVESKSATRVMISGEFQPGLNGRDFSPSLSMLQVTWDSIAARRPDRVELDLNEMSFITSQGMKALLELRRTVIKEGGHVVIAAMQPQIRELFHRIRLDLVFEWTDARDT